MKPTQIHETIAQQIDNVLPAGLVPGKDVGLEVVGETSLNVIVVPTRVKARINYDERLDLYDVTVRTPDATLSYEGVYCDQLGELIFGDEAKPFTLPIVMVSGDDGETWEQVA